MDRINGIAVIENRLLTKGKRQLRTHKAKRINKKWRKKYRYVDIPDKNVYHINNMIVGHPVTIKKMAKLINKGVIIWKDALIAIKF